MSVFDVGVGCHVIVEFGERNLREVNIVMIVCEVYRKNRNNIFAVCRLLLLRPHTLTAICAAHRKQLTQCTACDQCTTVSVHPSLLSSKATKINFIAVTFLSCNKHACIFHLRDSFI